MPCECVPNSLGSRTQVGSIVFMKIAINALFIQPNHNYGAGTYTLELLKALERVGQHEYVLIHNRQSGDYFRKHLSTIQLVEAPVSGSNRILRIGYEQFGLQRLARKLGCDLLFCPGYLGPIVRRMPIVLTIHDCQFRDIAAMINPQTRRTYEFLLPKAARVADHIIAISEFSKSRIQHHFKTPDSRVTTVLEGPPELVPDVTRAERQKVLDKFGITKPFLMSVSGKGPHKNFQRVKAGFLQFKKLTQADVEFVVVGHSDEREDDSIIYTGFVSSAERDGLYRAASAYVFGSLYEGFGLTLLEAMQAGLPVASSNAASLPEVGGDACVWFDPTNVDEIGRAIGEVLLDEKVREQCKARNFQQLQKFSWDLCARETEAVFRTVLHSSHIQ